MLVETRRRENNERIKVAILDTGIDLEHTYFSTHRNEIRAAYKDETRWKDFTSTAMASTDTSISVTDEVGHGTHAAALILKVAPKALLHVAKVIASATATDDTAKHIEEVSSTHNTTWN